MVGSSLGVRNRIAAGCLEIPSERRLSKNGPSKSLNAFYSKDCQRKVARMLVLETQSCDVLAVDFCLKRFQVDRV